MPLNSRPINYCDAEPPEDESFDQQSFPNSTDAVHAGEAESRAHRALTVPVVNSSVYTFRNVAELQELARESAQGASPTRETYGRYGNPTVRAAERKIASLEGAEEALLVSSGMTAIAGTLLVLLSSGDHMILTNESYHSTLVFCTEFLKRMGVECSVVPYGDYNAMEDAVQPNTRLIFSESPTNPFMHCLDMDQFVGIAKRHELLTIVDTTFAAPVNYRALARGVDIVIHSVTKYLAGHNDILAGAIAGSHERLEPLRAVQGMLGGIVSPETAFLILRGLKTLALRVQQQNRNGLAVAEFLADHPRVRRVWYLGLDSHPHHGLADAFAGYGGVVTFEINGTAAQTYRFIDALQIPAIGPSLGGVESLVSPLALIGYAEISAEERAALGISDELVRLCLGIEDTQDLLDDLAQALSMI